MKEIVTGNPLLKLKRLFFKSLWTICYRLGRWHPEKYCQECGGPNITWYAPSKIWNATANECSILCPVCFVKRAADAGYDAVWRIAPSGFPDADSYEAMAKIADERAEQADMVDIHQRNGYYTGCSTVAAYLRSEARKCAILAFLFLASGTLALPQTTNTTLQTNSFTYQVSAGVSNFTGFFVTTNLVITQAGTPVPPTNPVPPVVTNPAPVLVVLKASSVTPTGPFWVMAIPTNTITVKQVAWFVDGQSFGNETIFPYCLFGDDGVNPKLGTLPNGTHTIVARIFTNSALSFVSAPLNIVVAQASPPVSQAPTAPTNLVAVATGPGTIALTWQDSSPSLTSFFQIERSNNPAGPWLLLVAAQPANSPGYQDTGLLPSQTYYYRVEAGN